MTTTRGSSRGFSRRSVLLGAGAVMATAGCNLVGGGGDDPTDAGSTSGGEGGGLSGEITVALVPDPPGASEFYRAQFDLFQEANPGVTVNIIENPADQQLNALELMFQQGEGPDVMRVQGGAALTRFYDRGWVASLDDLVNDDFTARFPEGSLEPTSSGLHREGKLVSIPLVWGDWGYTHLWLYNTDILAENGYDAPPATWEEMVEMATTITENGGGSVFGTAPVAPQYFIEVVQPFAQKPGVNVTTGEPDLANPNVVAAVEVWRQLQANGVNMPGWESWDGGRPFTEFAAGRLAMYPTATWHVAEVRKLAPDIGMGIAPIPVPESGRLAYAARSAAHQPIWSMSAESANADLALAAMDFLGSVDFYKAYYEEFGSFTASQVAWEDQAQENEDQAGILAVAATDIRTAPNPELLAQGAEAFWADAGGNADLDVKNAYLESIVSNVDYEPLAAAIDTQVEALIVQYEAENADLRSQLTFADWDPLEDYTA
ncbi:ABC transporter substrate-binding protein [Occultella aeris]|uniref:Bacterial extracellular solute-binding protein n=1 Tax=Occultella aeris TaxID=2761496 RepID=A0A7M4DHK6_9MICO|nr:extracellular solute-binding protein [Occultella aeris]VZO36399.1 Bacterial extracellular solute-binding protein [Occultella aeris]